MNKVKANRAEAVRNNTEADLLGIEIPNEILASEKDMYHVLYIKTRKQVTRAGIEVVKYNPIVKKYDRNIFRTIADKYAVVGMGVPHILHDPTLPLLAETNEGEASAKKVVKTNDGKGLGDYKSKYEQAKELGFEFGTKPKMSNIEEKLAIYDALIEQAKELGLEVEYGIDVKDLQAQILEVEHAGSEE